MTTRHKLGVIVALVGAGMIGGLTAPLLANANPPATAPAASFGFAFQPIEPYRALDTRDGRVNPPEAGVWVIELPFGVRGAAVSVTVTDAREDGYVYVVPNGKVDAPGATVQPTTTVSYQVGDTVSGSTIAGSGTCWALEVHASSTAHVIVDVTGYLVSPGG